MWPRPVAATTEWVFHATILQQCMVQSSPRAIMSTVLHSSHAGLQALTPLRPHAHTPTPTPTPTHIHPHPHPHTPTHTHLQSAVQQLALRRANWSPPAVRNRAGVVHVPRVHQDVLHEHAVRILLLHVRPGAAVASSPANRAAAAAPCSIPCAAATAAACTAGQVAAAALTRSA
eukprot:249095-Chlamydomonas_euryale.AAC.3